MILHLPMFRIIIPANVSVIIQYFIQLVMFDILPAEYTIMKITEFDEEAESNYLYD
jgi:hypothetical protein